MHQPASSALNKDDVLHLVCPTQKRPQAILLCIIGLAVIFSGAKNQLHRTDGSISYISLAVAVAMAAFLVFILYRNLFWYDELLIVRNKQDLTEGVVPGLAAEDVRSVRRCPTPGAYSSEGKSHFLGLGPGLIEIETDTLRVRFGAGLSDVMADQNVDRIAAFCKLGGA